MLNLCGLLELAAGPWVRAPPRAALLYAHHLRIHAAEWALRSCRCSNLTVLQLQCTGCACCGACGGMCSSARACLWLPTLINTNMCCILQSTVENHSSAERIWGAPMELLSGLVTSSSSRALRCTANQHPQEPLFPGVRTNIDKTHHPSC